MMQKRIDDTIRALERGAEIVIVSGNIGYDSTIFWMTDCVLYSFSRALGVMERTDMSIDRLKDHLQNMHDEGASVFVRGHLN